MKLEDTLENEKTLFSPGKPIMDLNSRQKLGLSLCYVGLGLVGGLSYITDTPFGYLGSGTCFGIGLLYDNAIAKGHVSSSR
jgi:hypothetical protein